MVEVKICLGTTCYIMGGVELQSLGDYLPPNIKDSVTLSGCTCLDCCKNDEYGNAPFVSINGSIMGNASIGSVIDRIREELKQGEADDS